MNMLELKKPEDLEVGDEIVFIQSRGMGSQFEIRVERVRALVWDDGDLFVQVSEGNTLQLRGRELYTPVLIVGASC